MYSQDAVVIRTARPGDVPPLSALARRAWQDAFGGEISAEDQTAVLDRRSESYFRAALARSDKTVLVAEAEEVLVGYAQFGRVDVPEADAQPGDMGLQRVYVETSLHGRGIGRRLMEAALCDEQMAAAERVFLQVWEKNGRAIRLYESLGFRRIGTVSFNIGAMPAEDVLMVRQR